jgi:hypothetical protein
MLYNGAAEERSNLGKLFVDAYVDCNFSGGIASDTYLNRLVSS